MESNKLTDTATVVATSTQEDGKDVVILDKTISSTHKEVGNPMIRVPSMILW